MIVDIKAHLRERIRTNRVSFFVILPDRSIRVVSPLFFALKRRKGIDQVFVYEKVTAATKRLGRRLFGDTIDPDDLHHVHTHQLNSRVKQASTAPYNTVHISVFVAPEGFDFPEKVKSHLLDPYAGVARTLSENKLLREFANIIVERFVPADDLRSSGVA